MLFASFTFPGELNYVTAQLIFSIRNYQLVACRVLVEYFKARTSGEQSSWERKKYLIYAELRQIEVVEYNYGYNEHRDFTAADGLTLNKFFRRQKNVRRENEKRKKCQPCLRNICLWFFKLNINLFQKFFYAIKLNIPSWTFCQLREVLASSCNER